MRIDVFTLFPEWFDWMRRPRHLTNAADHGAMEIRCFSFRDSTPLAAGQVDDAPFGGGPGMVIRVDVVAAALEHVYGEPADRVRERRRVVVLTPRGTMFSDAGADELAGLDEIVLLCGRYEGFDQRVHDHLASHELCLGPFVLSGGETAAMTVIDAVARKIPGALGNPASLQAESFSTGLGGMVEYPHYTRPADYRGWTVPDVLRSGNHAAVERWRSEHLRPPG